MVIYVLETSLVLFRYNFILGVILIFSIYIIHQFNENRKNLQQRMVNHMNTVLTICPYCGVGCSLYLRVKENKIIGVLPAKNSPINHGQLCIKGWTGYTYVNHPKRLTRPLIKVNGSFVETTWDKALNYVANKLREIKEKYGPDSIMVFSSAKCTNEENYIIQKFARAVIGTNNVDHCARLCHASTVAGLIRAFGSGAMTNSIDDIEKTDLIFVIGSNTTEQHTIIGAKIINAVESGKKLIVADPRSIKLEKFANITMHQLPGTDIALLNAMANVIIEKNLYDKEFVETRTEDFEKLRETVKKYTPEYAEKITGVPASLIREAAIEYAKAKSAMIFFAMGITQHVQGTENVLAIANLAMLTGNVGKPGSGVNPLRGQNNVQGAGDMGALPNILPGYIPVTDTERKKPFEDAWGVKIPDRIGYTISETFELVLEGKLKAVYIVGENPAISDPNLNLVMKSLSEEDVFIVVQDIFLTETAEYADVVFPAAAWSEKEGTYTNTERRVQLLRKAVEPPGESKPDWLIIKELSERMGYPMNYNSPKDILAEINKLVKIYGGITWERLERVYGLQWPCPDTSHPGTKILHEGKFARGKGKFHPVEWKEPPDWRDEEYPFIMTTGRVYYQWHTGTMTRKIAILEREAPYPIIELNEKDMKELGVRENQLVRVISRRAEVVARVKVNNGLSDKVAFMPFHYKESPANKLVGSFLDPIAKIPEFKVVAVRVEVVE